MDLVQVFDTAQVRSAVNTMCVLLSIERRAISVFLVFYCIKDLKEKFIICHGNKTIPYNFCVQARKCVGEWSC